MSSSSHRFSEAQIQQLEGVFRKGADAASVAMARWLGVPSLMSIESIDLLPIEEAQTLLGTLDEPICFCSMAMTGDITGLLILAFQDGCGFALSDLVMNNPVGTAATWGDVEKSAAAETTNIIGCAFLNSLAVHLPSDGETALELIPTPPLFLRDYAESLLESVFMEQALTANELFVSESRFEVRGEPLSWTMLFVPDSDSIDRLQDFLSKSV